MMTKTERTGGDIAREIIALDHAHAERTTEYHRRRRALEDERARLPRAGPMTATQEELARASRLGGLRSAMEIARQACAEKRIDLYYLREAQSRAEKAKDAERIRQLRPEREDLEARIAEMDDRLDRFAMEIKEAESIHAPPA